MKPICSLLLTTSIAALMMAAPAWAQEARPDADPAEQTAPGAEPEAHASEQDDTGEAPTVENGEDGEPEGTELPPEPVVAIPAEWAPVPTDENERSAYGLYLAARAAVARGDTATGATLLQQTYELVPEQPRVREQAFTAAILAGDLNFAAGIVPDAEGTSPSITEAGQLIRGIELYLDRGARHANRLFAERPVDLPHDRAAVYAQVWIAAEAGDWDRALADPPTDFDPISALVARSHRARLLEMRRRHDEAEAEWKELNAHAVAGPLFRLGYGEFLERRNRRDEAAALYDAAIEARQADARLIEARQRIERGIRPPSLPRYREGVAAALRIAADQMIAQKAYEFAAVYLRLALQVEPSPQTQLFIGQSLINANLAGAGRAVLAEVPRDAGALFASARAQRGLSFDKADMNEEALAEFRLAAEVAPEDASIAYALANMLIKMERYDEALDVLNGPLLNTAQQGPEVRFLRGASLEALGRADEAEAELWAALQLNQEDPNILNYLGYLWVNSGKRVDEGAALIARAFASDPDNGNIQDSLGWAQFKQGNLAAALENLEQAVVKEPANAEINDHYGDVLWAVGRQREAGYQWQRVLTLAVEPERRAEVEAKLKERLGVVVETAAGDDTAGEQANK